jgi:hypothetical protein
MNDATEHLPAALPPVENRPNAVVDLSMESDELNAVGVACVFEDEKQVRDHQAFSALTCRKPFSKAEKTNLLLQFIKIPPHRLFAKVMLDDGSLVKKVFAYLNHSGKTNTKRERYWTVDVVASNLVRIKLLLEQSDKVQTDFARSTRDQEVRNLRQKLDKMIATAEQDGLTTVKKDATTRKHRATLPNTQRVQDHIPFDPAKVELEPCPVCGNMSTMAIDSREEIDALNAKNLQEHKTAVAEWEKKPAKERKSKPKARLTVSQTIACYSHKQHCLGRTDGTGCFACQTSFQNGMPHLIDGVCSCALCRSSCDVVFHRHQRTAVALEATKKKQNAKLEQQGT